MSSGIHIINRWLSSTPRRTFILYPVLIIAFELALGNGLSNNLSGMLFLVWGYLQYRLSGQYRTKHGGGGPGIENPPSNLVTTGIYQVTRNPMYSGHLIFMLGLYVTFASWPALALLIFHVWWFNRRVQDDELHMKELFGDDFARYCHDVRRWGIF